jgi:branched-chain amino acid transport system permease protein
VGGLSVIVWVIAGLLDGVGAFLSTTAAPGIGSGFQALVIPLAAAVLARFQNLVVGIGATIGLGVLRDAWSHSLRRDTDLFTVLMLVLVLGGLLLQRRRSSGRSESGADVSWAGTVEPRPIPRELREIKGVALARIGLISVAGIVVVLFPFIASTNRIVLAGVICVQAIAVLSLVVLTGWAGQVSLGQWALVAVGSVVGGSLTQRAGISFWLAVPLVTALTAGIAVLIGLPALRIKGLFLLVSTFIFAVAVQGVLFNDRYAGWLLPESVNRPTLFFINFEDEKSMYFLAVASLVLAIVVVGNLRRSRVGRLLIALRENEANVQAFGVSALRAKLMAFAVAGGLAGFAGVVFAHQQRGVSAESFLPQENVFIFLQAVIGGVSSSGGALLGAAYFQIVQEWLGSQEVVATFLTAGGPILILFIAPGGFISVVNAMRDSVLRVIAQRRRIVVPSLFADYDPNVLARRLIPMAEADPTSGLGALPVDERFMLASELYQGSGDRIVDRLEPAAPDAETSALNAVAANLEELEDIERDAAVGSGERT